MTNSVVGKPSKRLILKVEQKAKECNVFPFHVKMDFLLRKFLSAPAYRLFVSNIMVLVHIVIVIACTCKSIARLYVITQREQTTPIWVHAPTLESKGFHAAVRAQA